MCDDGSPEPLASVISPFVSRLSLTVLAQSNAGPASARNRGARQARARVLAFTDDDCIPAPDWLARLADRFATDPDNLVGGGIENTLPGDPYATATQLIMNCVYEYYDQHARTFRFFSTSNLAVPAQRFWEIGGFNENFPSAAGEDYDFCARWHEAGYRSTYAPEAIVGHAHGHTMASFCRQHFAYGRALLRVRQGIARRKGHPVRLEAPRFYGRLLSYPLRKGDGARGWLHAGLVLLAQLITGIGATREMLLGGSWGAAAQEFAHDGVVSDIQ